MGVAAAIALGALFASIAPLFAMWITFKQHSETDDDRDKDERLRRLEDQVDALTAENIRLMRQLVSQK